MKKEDGSPLDDAKMYRVCYTMGLVMDQKLPASSRDPVLGDNGAISNPNNVVDLVSLENGKRKAESDAIRGADYLKGVKRVVCVYGHRKRDKLLVYGRKDYVCHREHFGVSVLQKKKNVLQKTV